MPSIDSSYEDGIYYTIKDTVKNGIYYAGYDKSKVVTA